MEKTHSSNNLTTILTYSKCKVFIYQEGHHLEFKLTKELDDGNIIESSVYRFDSMDDIGLFIQQILHDLTTYVGITDYKYIILRQKSYTFEIRISDEIPNLINNIINKGINMFNKANI